MRPVPEREAARAAGERFYFTGKSCRNGHVVKRYTANGLCSKCAVKNTIKSQAKAPHHPNRIAARAAGARHYARGKPCIHGHPDKWFVANGICVQCSIRRTKKWNDKHPDNMAEGARRRRAGDPTKHRAEVKRWATKNPERVKAALRAWKAANLEYCRAKATHYARLYRLHQSKNGGFHTLEDIHQIHRLQGGCCAGCGKKTARLEVDHILAVLRGGSNNRSNLQMLCRRCNASKGARDAIEWAQANGRLL